MSPTPTPPVLEADGEDPCLIDVTDAAIDGVTVLICLCGLLGNGAMIWFLGYHSRRIMVREPLTIYILNMAISDFAFVLLAVISSFLYTIEYVFCIPIVTQKHATLLYLLSMFSCYIDLYLLTAISIERHMSILHPPSSSRPQWLTAIVCGLLWVISITVTALVTSLCMLQEYEQCKTAFITTFVLSFLIFAPPLVIYDVILCFKFMRNSERRQTKMLYIVIFLTDAFFLIFALPFRIFIFLQEYIRLLLSFKVAFLIISMNNTFCPFIYFLVGSCQRPCSSVSLKVAFQRVFDEPEDNSAHNNQISMEMQDPAC